jgi:hypothetical protein
MAVDVEHDLKTVDFPCTQVQHFKTKTVVLSRGLYLISLDDGLVVSSWLQIQRTEFDSRCYRIF